MKDESRPDQPSAPTPAADKPSGPKPLAPRSAPFFSSVDVSLLGLGSQMLSEVVAGVLIGYGLDYLLGTKNVWIVVGSLAGVAVAMFSVIRVALRPQAPRGDARETKPTAGSPPAADAVPERAEETEGRR